MKTKKKILCLLITAVITVSALAVGTVAAFKPLGVSTIEGKLTDPGEKLVIDTEFEGYKDPSLSQSTDKRVCSFIHPSSWIKYGSGYSGVTVYDYCAKSAYNKDADNKYTVAIDGSASPNLSADGDAIIWSSADKSVWSEGFTAPKNDDNNCIDLRLDSHAVKGGSFVLTVDLKMLTEQLSTSVPIFTVYCNHATAQIGSKPLYITASGALATDVNGANVVGQLKTDDYTTLSLHVKTIESSGDNDGSLLFDVYVDGKLVFENGLYLTAEEQSRIATLDKANYDTAEELEQNKATVTGLAEDYKITYVRILNTSGSIKGASGDYTGEGLYAIGSLRMYYSDTCYETAEHSATLTGHSVTIGDGVLGINHYYRLGSELLKDENADVVFTSPMGKVTRIPLSEGIKESNGTYCFTAYVNALEMGDCVRAEINNGKDTYNVYVNGKPSLYTENSVKEYGKAILDGALYSKTTKALVKAMLNYGAYSQLYFDRSIDKLPNSDCAYTDELNFTSPLSDKTITRVTGDGSITATLLLDTTIGIRVYKGSSLIGEKYGIYSTELDTLYTVGSSEDSVSVSVLAIAQKVVEGNYSEEYKNLAKAIKLYYDAAVSFKYTPATYDITSLTFGGVSLDSFSIVADVENIYVAEAAELLRTTVALKSGISLPIVSTAEAGEHNIYVRLVSDAGNGGFRIKHEGANVFFECQFRKKLSDGIQSFLDSEIISKTGSVAFASGYTYEKVVNVAYYKDFGAVGDGVTDDYMAIRDAHLEANAEGYTVCAESGKTYYLPPHTATIPIMTNVNWNGARFIIDDKAINYNGHAAQNVSIFSVEPELRRITLNISSLKKGDTNIGVAPGVDCMVFLQYKGERHYIRYGNNANNGAYQQEVILVKANGDVDPTTPITWDYPEIDGEYAIPINETPIVIENGDFTTYANEINPDKYISVKRNIELSRSNVTVRNVDHRVVQVQDYRAAYAGFFRVSYVNNVLIQDCEIFCHKDSYFVHPDNGQNVLLGSYEISGGHSIGVTYDRVVQTNLFNEDGSLHNQGLMGTNYCRNMQFLNSTIARFDAHSGLYNVTVKGSKIQRVNAIGHGTVIIEDTQVYGDYMIDLRSDYGAHFDGDLYVKNVTMMNPKGLQSVAFFSGSWANHDFGYEVVHPQNIYVDGLTVKGPTNKIYLFNTGINKYSEYDLTAETVNGEANLNRVTPTKQIKITSNPAGTEFLVNEGKTFEGRTKVNNVATNNPPPIEYVVWGAFADKYTKTADGYISGGATTPNGTGSIVFQITGNNHTASNLKTVYNEGDQAILFSGKGNINNATKTTNLCAELRPGTSTAKDKAVYDKYKGKSFVVEYELKPITQTTDKDTDLSISLFTFASAYVVGGSTTFVASSVATMSMSDFSIKVKGNSTGVKLKADEYSTIAIHVDVPNNTFDLYVNGTLVANDATFLESGTKDIIATYDSNGNLVASTAANKMNDFMFTYARIALTNAWKVDGDIYELDNARLYYSDTYYPPVK